MNDSPPLRLSGPTAREAAVRAVSEAPEGYLVEIREPTRNRDQNAALHAALTDIAKQVTWHGKTFNVLTWKRLTMASFLREIGQQPELIPALDGNGFDLIFERTSKLGIKQFSAYLEWVTSFGAQHGVIFRSGR